MKKQPFGHILIPLQRIHVELTNVCDFNCRFCPKSQMTRPYGYMATDLAKRLIAEIGGKHLCEKITFHVMGEPTLHPDFFEILDFAGREGVHVGLTTNGGGLGGAVGKRLLGHPLYQLDISIQTPDEKSFALRKAGRLRFEEYIDGILNFFRAYRNRYPDTIIKFRFMNTRFRKKGLERKKGPIRLISSTKELQEMFRYWTGRIYALLDVDDAKQRSAFRRIGKLVSYKWHVVEIYPRVVFETYVLNEWGHAFDDSDVHKAWAGYCYGMRDHFSILYNGDVILCCIDYDGRTVIGNAHSVSLEEILSSDRLGSIIEGFNRFRLVHPYCKKCLGSRSFSSWLVKPIGSILGLKLLRSFFYTHTNIYDSG
jgi:MoaA/NifB/PqqE/SkfB family radical SAM enzyme